MQPSTLKVPSPSFDAGPVVEGGQLGVRYRPVRTCGLFGVLLAACAPATHQPGAQVELGGCAQESCNGRDDDCDGAVDEGIERCAEMLDRDQDGLSDAWEQEGIDLDGDGRIDLDLPAMGADPLRKDVFVEVDWMEIAAAGGHSDRFDDEAFRRVQRVFLEAPVDNPDGSRGIALHVDAGPESLMDPRTGASWGELSRAGPVPHEEDLTLERHGVLRAQHMGEGRLRVFRYVIAAHSFERLPRPPPCDGETVRINGFASGDRVVLTLAVEEGLFVTLGGFLPGVRDVGQQAGLFMHELGHTLGLDHGGADGINRKPNYLSVMNYAFTYRGVPTSGGYGGLDYGRYGPHTLDEGALRELDGLAALGAEGGTIHHCGDVGTVCADDEAALAARIREVENLSAPIDWNCDGALADVPASAEVNLEPPRTALTVRNDWKHLDLTAGRTIGAAPGLTPVEPAPTCGADTLPPRAERPPPHRVTAFARPTRQLQPEAREVELVFAVYNSGARADRYALQLQAPGLRTLRGPPSSVELEPGAWRELRVRLELLGPLGDRTVVLTVRSHRATGMVARVAQRLLAAPPAESGVLIEHQPLAPHAPGGYPRRVDGRP